MKPKAPKKRNPKPNCKSGRVICGYDWGEPIDWNIETEYTLDFSKEAIEKLKNKWINHWIK